MFLENEVEVAMLRRWLWLEVALPLTVWGQMVTPDAGVTPLMLVSRSGTAAQIEAALLGADLNSRTRYRNRGALEFALENPQPLEAVSLLPARGADAKIRDAAGAEPLTLLVLNHGAAAATDVGRRLMRELVRRGNDVNATGDGRLLLDQALERNQPELFEALVACGADPGRSACDRSKLSPYLRRRMAELVGE